MNIQSVNEYIKVLNKWKRNGTNGKVSLQDIALVYAWNYVPDEVVLDVISHYDYKDVSKSLFPTDINDWKNKVLFNN
jgi:hypothetical protein